ncbi:MAG: right-handed parallel beta-helix repeat-containing protein [Deltaproteobacteria bacterium]|nr:right-handed parallel beta-helix repeat-containing protein [Deltaproteobacteria bacterium]
MFSSNPALRLCAALVAVGALSLGCGDDAAVSGDGGASDSAARDGTTADSGTLPDAAMYTAMNPATDCPGRLAPVEPAGRVEVVGDGTAASCSEDALHAAATALNGAEGGGTLTFDCGGEHTVALTRSLFVSNTMILDGGGDITLSGGGAVRVIELDHHVDFVVQRLTIRGGYVAAGSENESGAGLLHPWFGTLRAIDVTFDDNHSASQANDVGGGAVYAGGLTEAVLSGCTFTNNSGSTGGGVLSRSTNLRVVDNVFFNNSATTYAESGQYGNGGGLYIDRMWLDDPVDFSICGTVFDGNHAKVHGSAFFSYNLEGTGAVFDRCTFRNNDMAGSPGGGTGTVYHQGVPLLLINSTISRNSTGEHAGGLFLGGGTDAQITNCTFEGNETPGNAGALWAGNGRVQVTHSTFAHNRADYGPVIFKGMSGTVRLTNVVMHDNGTDNEFSALACHATFDDGGGNVQWPATKNNGNADNPCAESVLFADPELEALADNGGPTETMALPTGSPVLDLATECSEYDQRGTARTAPCDPGAYEHEP